ncbi:hypothetical protein J7373_18925 [Xanthomonas sp. A2111]|uniref:Lipocalin-like domain-containing protein n=1 Tax=Xanthomonas hawaiiensis TaxID=3003247 RepID=A0ABU2I0H1_9XANT|nr:MULTISPECIES: hypothetical protein [unclassified Xanthomonas]MBO9830334.1 hypothetical protein [Xanthomonas sp. A2111]MBO9872138.1 hypothetical protein [Xanthomonas sp. D-93]MDS9991143.1 hypothetical protein [Xanthomonas sp. A2111]WNH46808.1 hypothetical protein PG878_10375 [Xanthomonas sp. A6251]
MFNANAASIAGRWSLEGVPSPSGTSTATASIKERSDGGCELTLPPELQPAIGAQSIALSVKGNGVYSARAKTEAEVTLSITEPDRANLSIVGKSTFSRFEVVLRKIEG